jgi:hypothetical protein
MSLEDKQNLIDREANFVDTFKGKGIDLVFIEGDDIEFWFVDGTFARLGINFVNRQPLIVIEKQGKID